MKKVSFRQKCIDNNINHDEAKRYKHLHLELTDEQIIEFFLQRKAKQNSFRQRQIKQKSFRQECLDNNINYEEAKRYKHLHPELTNEQIIEFYLQRKTKIIQRLCR